MLKYDKVLIIRVNIGVAIVLLMNFDFYDWTN